MELALSPHGHLHVREPDASDIAAAFARGAGHGVLHLGAVHMHTSLAPPFAYVRDLGHELVARIAAHPELEALRERLTLDPPRDYLARHAAAAPPMVGAEYVDADVLAEIWREAIGAFAEEIASTTEPVAAWLRAKNPAWATVGRVYFHVAENKRNDDLPFAFLATYTTHVTARGTAKHRPLGSALEEYGAARDKDRLLALLVPVERATEKSAFVKALVESGDIYHPLAWSPREAYAFLQEVPALEASGVMVRVPDWWSSRRRSRATVKVEIGAKAPTQFGADAMLDFAADLAIDGEPLTDEERRVVLEAASGLVFVKGRWVEADGEKLRAVLAHWERVESAAEEEGVSFHDAMRFVTGAAIGHEEDAAIEAAEWSQVEPGPWMASVLDGLRAPDALADVDAGGDLHATLRPYQRTGVRWLKWAHDLELGACLADDMGLGKTLQVIALLLLRRRVKKSPALLVVPASLVLNWSSEIEKFAPKLRVVIAHSASAKSTGGADDIDAADAVLTTYGSLARTKWLSSRAWDLVVLDEAQAIKNPAAQQTRLVKSLRARARLALTGTPVENRLGDLWSLFDFLQPRLLGTPKEFGSATKAMAKSDEGYAPLRALVRPYILRRMKTDTRVISDLPDKTEVTAFASLTRMQAALYEQAVKDLARALANREGIERRGAILAALTRFKQICNHPSQWLGDGAWAPEASGKFLRLGEICEPIASRQEKALVFTQFRETTAPLAAFLRTVFGAEGLVLHGGTVAKKRKEMVDAFQSDAGPPFFVLSLKAGGTGLNLTAAAHVVHFDRWWNPAVENQATDRAYRIGQKKNVLVHKMICRGTIEERIDALIASKRALADAIVGDDAGDKEISVTEMSNEEIMKLVSLDLAGVVK